MTKIYSRAAALSVLAKADANSVKELAETLLPQLGEVTVLKNRTGLVMLPYNDSVQGIAFHLGEVLVAEAHIRTASGEEGYGMVIGRDVVQAMALAVIDAAIAANIMNNEITGFLTVQAEKQAAADIEMLKQVESTRVEMETF
jgi:alpha-D-ribose 1-methylphosphonate 5-triphosphate synthase subunit PhnG